MMHYAHNMRIVKEYTLQWHVIVDLFSYIYEFGDFLHVSRSLSMFYWLKFDIGEILMGIFASVSSLILSKQRF